MKDFMATYGEDLTWELAQIETLGEFKERLEKQDIHLGGDEAEVLMAALYPLRGKKRELSEEDLDGVSGGWVPRPTFTPVPTSGPTTFIKEYI